MLLGAFVCVHNNSKSNKMIFLKFFTSVGFDTRKNPLNFGIDLDQKNTSKSHFEFIGHDFGSLFDITTKLTRNMPLTLL